MPREFGTPDGLNESDYGDTEGWDHARWRWEFLRRRNEVRAQFHSLAMDHFGAEHPKETVPADLMFWPEYRDKLFPLNPAQAASLGYAELANPFFSNSGQALEPKDSLPFRRIGYAELSAVEQGWIDFRSLLSIGSLAIVFDPDRPLKPQLEGLEKYLRSQRHHALPQEQERAHRNKWLEYLRILDAREAGYTWRVCAKNILPQVISGTEQSARDRHKQAKLLQSRL